MKREGRSIFESFRDAFRGLWYVTARERNFRIHICMAAYVIYFSFVAALSAAAVLAFLICFGLVLSLELINTAVEKLCDVVTEERDERIRVIKDVSAASVLVSAVFAAAAGLFVFLSPSVLNKIISEYISAPYLLLAFPGTVPLAVWFIAKRSKK